MLNIQFQICDCHPPVTSQNVSGSLETGEQMSTKTGVVADRTDEWRAWQDGNLSCFALRARATGVSVSDTYMY